VIKVERPGSGDFARGYDERVRGLASHFVWTNRSKESLTLDVKHPEARAILAKLVAGADVLVQNLAPAPRRASGFRTTRCRQRIRGSSSATSRATATAARIATRRPTTCWSRASRASCRSRHAGRAGEGGLLDRRHFRRHVRVQQACWPR
jgi:hypothetical protein